MAALPAINSSDVDTNAPTELNMSPMAMIATETVNTNVEYLTQFSENMTIHCFSKDGVKLCDSVISGPIFLMLMLFTLPKIVVRIPVYA